VRHGGYAIPVADIERRFVRSLENLFGGHAAAVNQTVCFLNSGERPEVLFIQVGEQRDARLPTILKRLPGWRPT
jgi:predicted ABC-type ATPase